MSWSKDPDVLKVVFLVGDCPPHMDYRGDVKYPATCRDAVKRLIVINTVQCGGVAATTPVWQEIARLSEGSYVALAQDGNMQAMATPYDGEIAEVSAGIGRTLIAYGKLEVQVEVREKAAKAEAAPVSVAADRAVYNLASGGKAVQGAGDLVADLGAGTVDLAKLAKGDLPVEMQRMNLSEQRAYVQGRQAERDVLNARLEKLSRAARRLDRGRALPDRRHRRFLRPDGFGDDQRAGRAGAEIAARNSRSRITSKNSAPPSARFTCTTGVEASRPPRPSGAVAPGATPPRRQRCAAARETTRTAVTAARSKENSVFANGRRGGTTRSSQLSRSKSSNQNRSSTR